VEQRELASRAKKGDKEALISLVMMEKDSYYRLALTYMRNPQDAQDMLQDMIVALYINIGRLRELDKFYSWSKTILVNLCKKELARVSSKKSISLEEAEEITDADINIEDKVDIERYLEQLTIKHQEVIRLRYFLDMDYSEIADILKVPLGTVKSRLNSAMSALRSAIKEEHYNE
jgi:RNA polymerase sigma-70 factor (ECF subfamily)